MQQQRFAVAYARVSHPDQAKKDLSVPAQYRRIDEWATKNNVTVVYRDADEGVSAHDEKANREAFNRCVEIACTDKRVTLFLIDDSARFYRDSYMSGTTKGKLRENNVKVLITSNPYDPTTIAGKWMEKIDEAKDETSSMMTAFYTFRGQEENIQTRDPETGWCYKNGGRAPFGYRAVKVIRGQNIRHLDIVKVIWEKDEPAAEVLRFMYIECRLNKQMSYKAIWKELNERNMYSPTPDKPWSISSVIEMMRPDRVLQNAGWGIWNKEDHKTKGRRFKDKSEWVWVERAHPAIITQEEADKLIAMNRTRSEGSTTRRSESSPYLLTGKNILGEDMFVCSKCGARMTGFKPSSRHRMVYICGSVRYRGTEACDGKTIDQKWIEDNLLKIIRKRFGTRKRAEEIARLINKSIESETEAESKAAEQLRKKIQSLDMKIKNLIRAMSEGIDISEVADEIKAMKEEKTQAERTLDGIQYNKAPKPQLVSADQILGYYNALEEAWKGPDVEAKRKLLRSFVRRLEFDPREDSLKMSLFDEPTTSAVVFHMDGAQDRTCSEWNIDRASMKRFGD
jgi:site-specific DNA recombinase